MALRRSTSPRDKLTAGVKLRTVRPPLRGTSVRFGAALEHFAAALYKALVLKKKELVKTIWEYRV